MSEYAAPTPPDLSTPAVESEIASLESEVSTQDVEYGINPAEVGTPVVHSGSHSAEPTTEPPSDVSYDHQGQPEQGTAPTSDVIGDPNQDASQWSFQGANGYCGPNSITMLIEASSGHQLTEQDVAGWAITNGEMTQLPPQDDTGGPSIHYGMLPQQAVDTINQMGAESGVSATLQYGDVNELEGCLSQGKEVMIELDDQRIWHQAGVKDTDSANHYVVVTGFDPSTDTVFINDPGTPDGKEESIPLSEFKSAWATSNNVMIVTSSSSASQGWAPDPTTTVTPSTPTTPTTTPEETGGGGMVLLPVVISSEFVRSA